MKRKKRTRPFVLRRPVMLLIAGLILCTGGWLFHSIWLALVGLLLLFIWLAGPLGLRDASLTDFLDT